MSGGTSDISASCATSLPNATLKAPPLNSRNLFHMVLWILKYNKFLMKNYLTYTFFIELIFNLLFAISNSNNQ